MCFDPGTPPDRHYGAETLQNLTAQVAMAPALYASEAAFRPKYNQLAVQGVQDVLLGARGAGGQRSGGLLDVYANNVAPTLRAVERNADPLRTGLKDAVMAQGLEEMRLGSALDESTRNEVQQASRAAWSDRGLVYSPASGVDEIFLTGERANRMRRERQNYALSALGMPSNNAATVAGFGQQAAGLAGGAGPRLFNPESGYAGDIFNTNYNADAASRIAAANNTAGVVGGLMSSL